MKKSMKELVSKEIVKSIFFDRGYV